MPPSYGGSLVARGRRACPWSTSLLLERERPGCNPVFQDIGAVGADQTISPECTRALDGLQPGLRGLRARLGCERRRERRPSGAGDGLRSEDADRHSQPPPPALLFVWPSGVGGDPVSVPAISAALLLGAVTPGERLAAFALASYANPEQRAWPSNPVAAARAGLSRSQYLAARDGLARRGLVRVEDQGGGRSRSSTIALDFAAAGPWYDGRVNPQALEAALGHSAARGPARQLLAVIASVADDDGIVASLTVEEIRALAGLADSTYRRARAALLRALEVTVDGDGGRGCLNRWVLCGRRPEPSTQAARPVRVPPPAGARPLLAQVTPPGDPACAGSPALTEKGLVPGGVLASNSPNPGGVLDANRPVAGGVSPANGPNAGGAWLRTPPQTPPETPPLHVRACKERRNHESGTSPPAPRPGGSPLRHITIVEDFTSERGRRRQRHVRVDLDDVHAELREPQVHDIACWQQIRSELGRVVGETAFAVWLDALTLGAVDRHGALVLSCPFPTRKWVIARFARAFDRAGSAHGRRVQLADDRQQQLLDALATAGAQQPIDVHIHKEAS